jgi:sugar lactone lactonase YvrE
MKKALIALLLIVVYLLAWPTRVAPRAWTPPPAPPTDRGPYAYNEALKNVQRLAVDVGIGPEGIAVDATGRVYAGYRDGRVIVLSADGASYAELGTTSGRPLGIGFSPTGGLVIADAVRGLLQLGGQPRPTLLSAGAEGLAFGFTDDVDDAKLGHQVYFSDASSKFAYPDYLDDLLEHGANGRLLAYDLDTRKTAVLLRDLYFANGVAVGPDDAYVLVNETSAYRITRYWLKGPKAGTREIFVDDLPGFPDNLSFNGRDRFWVALASPRDPLLDALAGHPFLRRIVARLPAFLQPGPKKHSWVLGFDLDGRLIANLQYRGRDAYAPITSVQEYGPWLYFGSLTENAIARLPLRNVIATAPAPPSGWRSVPAHPRAAPRASQKGVEEGQ